MQSESSSSATEPQDSSSEDETSFERDSDVDFLVSSVSLSDSSSESEDDNVDTACTSSVWTPSGLVWSPSHAETQLYIPASTNLVSGPTIYAISRIYDVESSFNLLFTAEMIQLILEMTNLQGRRSVVSWADVDATEIKA